MTYCLCYKNRNKHFQEAKSRLKKDLCIISTIRKIKKLEAAVSVLMEDKPELITKSKFIYMKDTIISNTIKEQGEFYKFLDCHEKHALDDLNS
jgi:hypothetical protein